MDELYDDLYDLVLKFTDDNVKMVAYWVLDHKSDCAEREKMAN